MKFNFWYRGYNIVLVSLLFQGIIFGSTFYCFTLWIDYYAETFNSSRAQIVSLIIIFQIGVGCFAPVAGYILDRFNSTVVISIGVVLSFLGFLLLSYAGNFFHSMLIYGVILVLANSFAGTLAAQTIVSKWFLQRKATFVAVVSLGTSIGGLVVPQIASYLLESNSWQEAHRFIAYITLASLLPLVIIFVRVSPISKRIRSLAKRKNTKDSNLDQFIWTPKQVFRQRTFWILTLCMLPLIAGFSSFQHNIGPLIGELGLNTQAASYTVSSMAGAMLLAKLLFSLSVEKIDHRVLFWFAGGSQVAALLIMTIGATNFQAIILSSILFGISAGSILPLMGAIISTRFGSESFGMISGLAGPFLLFATLGPWGITLLADLLGSYTVGWVIMAILLIPGLLAFFWLPPTRALVPGFK